MYELLVPYNAGSDLEGLEWNLRFCSSDMDQACWSMSYNLGSKILFYFNFLSSHEDMLIDFREGKG